MSTPVSPQAIELPILRERIEIPGSADTPLVALIDRPDGPVRGHALLAHCFTCSKDTIAAARVARALAAAQIVVTRVDFTGLGESAGDFADTTFSSNIEDLVLTADALRERGMAPDLLVGHSLGGAAVLAAAEFIPEVRAVATIAAPEEPIAVERHLADGLEQMAREGEAVVMLAGRPMRIRQSFVDDLAEHSLADRVAALGVPLLLMHSPDDEQLGFDVAERLYAHARQPKSLIALDGADHLLTADGAAERAGRLIALWADQYLPAAAEPASPLPAGAVSVRPNGLGAFGQDIAAGRHRWLADEPTTVRGALDTGPNPYDMLLAALGACTSMTMRMYADHKGFEVDDLQVVLSQRRMHADDCAECETAGGHLTRIERSISISGDLTPEQRAGLMRIADKCPVHRTLNEPITIVTYDADAAE